MSDLIKSLKGLHHHLQHTNQVDSVDVMTVGKAADALTEQAATIERLTAFIEELRDYKPEIHSGRQQDPQDDVPDIMEADVFLAFQDDAIAALNKEPTQ